ncbi:hypothetical protein AB1Y20_004779 [Prymnesium parvum]|uniref:Pre-mRNA-splicing factor 18 n=1 Tax=Prymnesium parvum TaxID=97485 RepID=A0AB34J094_PRYPA
MEAIQAEIARKRKEREEAMALAGGGAEGGKKKWVRRGDEEQYRQQRYLAERAAAEEAEKERQRRADEAWARQAGLKKEEAEETAAREQSAAVHAASLRNSGDLRPVDVKRLLRKLSQPIQLFGETDEERLERYRAASAVVLTEKQDDALALRNPEHGFADKQLLSVATDWKTAEVDKKPSEAEAEGGDADEAMDEELAPSFVAVTPEQQISRHFKQLLKLWEEELASRSEADASSAEGKKTLATYQQCRRHMKPFFKQLKHRTMPLDVLNAMTEITVNMQKREYVLAGDAYIRCAIGSAPWPMGISGTGVHERQGRQHIREDKVAHVMNDETMRKYLQSVKRLITFGQRVFPATGPSKQVS